MIDWLGLVWQGGSLWTFSGRDQSLDGLGDFSLAGGGLVRLGCGRWMISIGGGLSVSYSRWG